jgi:hypothetical protein
MFVAKVDADMKTREFGSQVINGVRAAGEIIFSVIAAGGFLGGIHYAFYVGRLLLGLVLLSICGPIMLFTVHRWIRQLQGILVLAIMTGLVMLASGHLIGRPSIPVSRPGALVAIIFLLGGALLAGTFAKRRLRILDRIAIMGFVSCLVWWMLYDSSRSHGQAGSMDSRTLVVMGLGLLSLALGWFYDSHKRRAKSGLTEECETGVEGECRW